MHNIMQFDHDTFFTRYVDNRLCVLKQDTAIMICYHKLWSLNLDQQPVTLEDVEGSHFLGFTKSINPPSIRFKIPWQSWKYRSTNSAGSKTMNITGLTSRLHTICRCTMPRRYITQDTLALCQQYINKGSNKTEVMFCRTKILSKYRLLKPDQEGRISNRTTAQAHTKPCGGTLHRGTGNHNGNALTKPS